MLGIEGSEVASLGTLDVEMEGEVCDEVPETYVSTLEHSSSMLLLRQTDEENSGSESIFESSEPNCGLAALQSSKDK